MATEWTSTKSDLPIVGTSVIASIKDENSFYSEFLTLEKDGSWIYQNGNKLEENKKVVGWMDGPSTFLG